MFVADQSCLSQGRANQTFRQDRIYLSPRQLNVNRQQVSKKYYNQLNNPYLRNERRMASMVNQIEHKNMNNVNAAEITQVSFGDDG